MATLFSGQIVNNYPAAAFSDLLKTWVGSSGLANWSFVENIPAGVGAGTTGDAAFSTDIFKCAGSGDDANDAGQDWYISINRYVTEYDYTLKMTMAEVYDNVNKKFQYFPLYKAGASSGPASSDANDYAYYSTVYSTNAYDMNQIMDSYATIFNINLTHSGFEYWCVLDNDFIQLGLRIGNTEAFTYLGLMDSLIKNETDTLPLVIINDNQNHSGAGQYQGAFIRLPGVGAVAGVNCTFGARPTGWNGLQAFGVAGGTLSSPQYNDLWADNKIRLSRILMHHAVATSVTNVWGCVRGLLKPELLCCYQPAGTMETTLGDTFEVDGETYTVTGASNSNPYYSIVYKGE